MASRKQPATMVDLPDDLVYNNIFIWLPAKPLARMRCVCKPWNAFLSQPSFIKSHFDRSIQNNDEILMIFEDRFSFGVSKSFTAHASQSPHRQITNLIKLPVNIPTGEEYSNVVIGSVNGLICFSSYEFLCKEVIYIWNPSLSALLPLPPYNLRYYSDFVRFFRFVFFPKTNDYKVVKLSFFFDYPNNPNGIPPVIHVMQEVEVFSMIKGCWKVITSRFPSDITNIQNENEVCIDGHDGRVHWLCDIGEEKNEQVIVTFDLGVETFGEISLPHQIQDNNGNRTFVLGNVAGKVCVMSCVENGDLEVWVMNEYGVAESWVKQHIFSQFGGKIDPFGFTSKKEFLFGVDRRIALYDQNASKVKLFMIMRPPGSTRTVRYVESLFWVEAPS